MATRVWLGAAVPAVEITDFVFGGTWLPTETVTVTIGAKSLILTVGAGRVDLDEIADDVEAMINGDAVNGTETRTAIGTDVYEFTGVVALSDSTDTVRVTGPDSYRPIGLTMTTDSASGTITPGVVSAATGPAFANNTANWSGGALPVDADDIVFDHRASSSCLYELDELDDVSPASVTIDEGFKYQIGLPDVNADNSSQPYDEYLETYLKLCVSGDSTNTAIYINAPQSSRIRLNTQTGQATIRVDNTGYREGSVPALTWKGTHASNTMTVNKGDVGIAVSDSESATLASLTVGAGATVLCGDGATLTTVNNTGGTLTTQSNVTTLTQTGGKTYHKSGRGAAATLTTAVVRGGTLYYESSGTLTTLTVMKGGIVDLRNDVTARTFSNILLYAGYQFHDPEGSVTATNGYDLVQCSPLDGTFNVQPNRTWTPTTI